MDQKERQPIYSRERSPQHTEMIEEPLNREASQEVLQPSETEQVDHDQHEEQDTEQVKLNIKLPKKNKQKAIPIVRDQMTSNIEQIMQSGLEDAYRELSPIDQQKFKVKDEETAQEIRQLMKSTRVKVKKVFTLLIEWLKMLPGINRFFLEQEAKIKTDKILSLKHHDRK